MAKTSPVSSSATTAPTPNESGLCPPGYARDSNNQCYPVSSADQGSRISGGSTNIPGAAERMLNAASEETKGVLRSTPFPKEWWEASPAPELSGDPRTWFRHALTAGTELQAPPERYLTPGSRHVTRENLELDATLRAAQQAAEDAKKERQNSQGSPPPETKSGQGPALKPPPPGDATDALSKAVMPDPDALQPLFPGFVKVSDGRIITTAANDKAGLSMALPAGWDPKAEAKRFMAGRVPSRDTVASLGMTERAAAGPEKGSWTFSGGIGKGGARTGTYTPSRSERVTEAARFEGRLRARDEADEMRGLQLDLNRAKADYMKRTMALDPYEMARIQAQGRYGAEMIKSGATAASRDAALSQYEGRMKEIMAGFARREAVINQTITDPAERAKALAGIQARREQLQTQAARDAANILLGERITDPNAMAAMMSALMGGGMGMGAAAGATAAGEK